MKAEEILKLAREIADMKKQEKSMPRRRTPRNFKHLQRLSDENIAELVQRKWRELDELNGVVEDRQKAKKKEDKKPEKMSVFQVAVLLMAGYPIIAAIGFLFWWLK